MRRAPRRTAIAAALVFALPVLPSTAATLGDAVTSALTLAEQLPRAAALRDESAAIRVQAASLTAEDPAVRLKGLSDRFTENDGAYELEAMLDLPLWLPGQRDARQALADAVAGQADGLSLLLHWRMAGLVREAVWDAALAHGRLRQAAAALTSARSLEQNVAKRSAAGELARMELVTAQQETLAREVELAAAQVDYDKAIAVYVQLTGEPRLPEPLNQPVVPPTLTEPLTLPPDHPLLAGAGGDVGRARAARERVAADRHGHPLLSLGAKRARDDRSLDAVDALQLEVSIPFGLKRQHAPELAGAERALTDQLADLQQLRRDAERALNGAVLARRGAEQALTVAERRASLAQQALSITRRAFDLGEADLTALLRAEEGAREANLDLALRTLETGRALARLNQALGLMPWTE